MKRRVVITGLGTVNPCGADVCSSWSNIRQGRSGIGYLTRFDASGWPSNAAGEVKDFDGVGRFGRKATKRMGLFTQYALVAGAEAMEDAGFREGITWPVAERFAVYVASGIGGIPEIFAEAETFISEGVRRISPYFIPRSLGNLAAGHLAIRFKAKGPSLVMSTACAAGNHAIGEALRLIQYGESDVALAGGTEAALTPLGYGGFMNMRALSRRDCPPEKASRPFDAARDGFVMGEGAGLVVLESYEHAVARGAKIYCELVGYAATTDAHHETAPSPDGDGAVRCMRLALNNAGLTPASVDYINAHGTSTPANDATETHAIRTVFGLHADSLAVSSTKGVTGHLLGAAGGLESIIVSKVLETGWMPPTANYEHRDPRCDLNYLGEGPVLGKPEIAMSNAFGFGGTNATLVFQRFGGRNENSNSQ